MTDTRVGDLSDLARIQRTLRLVQRCRRALLHAVVEQDLLQAVCDAAIEEGGYLFAWVGVATHDAERRVRPVAQAGRGSTYLDAIDIRWADVPEGRGPTGLAVRERRPYWARFIATDPALAPWRDRALAHGFQSSIALPMSTDDGPYGALTIYAGVPDAFDTEEVTLLSELADDLAFGIRTHRSRLAQRSLTQVVELSPAVVVITDEHGDIEYVNRRFTELTGYTADEAYGRNPRFLKSGLTPAHEYERLWKTVTSGGRWTGEFLQRRKDGSTYHERAAIQPIADARGTVIKYFKVAEDTSERQALEEQLRHAQKMEAIGRLAGGIAHDFNNLLTVIQGFTELAVASLPGQTPVQDDLQQVLSASEQAAVLTRQLLAFSRRQVLTPDFIDVAAVARATVPMLRRLVGENVVVDLEIAEHLCVARAEPGQIEQILMNLVVNARDAMPDGGRLHLAVGPVNIDDSFNGGPLRLPLGPYVRIEVADSGVGMEEETRARIFEPFFTTKPAGTGTGLGLSTVYGIVTQAGGDIDVTSAPREGSTFRVYLPLVNDHPEVVNAPAETAVRPRGSEAILVVDDDAAVAQFASRVLRRAGFDVRTASSPGEALLMAEADSRIDLVLTDLVMPQLNGRELARRLGQAIPGLRVLYMSGYADDVLFGQVLFEDRVRVVRKPFTADALAQMVRAQLDSTGVVEQSGTTGLSDEH